MAAKKNTTKRIETTKGDILVVTKGAARDTYFRGSYEFNYEIRNCKRSIWFDNFGGAWVNIDGVWYRSNFREHESRNGFIDGYGYYGFTDSKKECFSWIRETLITAVDFKA